MRLLGQSQLSNPSDLPCLAATKQLNEWYFPSVCLSVCLYVTHFWLCSHHRIIMKFSGVITNDRNDVHAKGQGQRSKVKVTKINTQLSRFRTVTPVWIHIWWWNDEISRSHGLKNLWFESNFSEITRPVAAIKSLRFALLIMNSLWFCRSWKPIP